MKCRETVIEIHNYIVDEKQCCQWIIMDESFHVLKLVMLLNSTALRKLSTGTSQRPKAKNDILICFKHNFELTSTV